VLCQVLAKLFFLLRIHDALAATWNHFPSTEYWNGSDEEICSLRRTLGPHAGLNQQVRPSKLRDRARAASGFRASVTPHRSVRTQRLRLVPPRPAQDGNTSL
jgi:hypothetical protein